MTPGRRKHFFENLDALRLFSFFAVFLSHAFFTAGPMPPGEPFQQGIGNLAHLGRLGVDFFFVLSSFLITWIILEELGSTQNFKLGYFYLRRILRIWPLYFLLVFTALAWVAFQHAAGWPLSELPPVAYLFTFTLNFYISSYGPHFLFFLVFLWSIAVEEQFYLGWALVLKFLGRYLSAICWLFIGISLFFRWSQFPQNSPLYFHTLSVICDFAIGALFAKTAWQKTAFFEWVRRAKTGYWIFLYVVFFITLVFYDTLFHSREMVSIERAWFALLFGLVIMEQNYSLHSPVKFGRWPLLNELGKRSYGMYCYHGIVLTLASKYFSAAPVKQGLISWVIVPVVLFLFTTLAASVSYRFFEKPFLQLKQRYY